MSTDPSTPNTTPPSPTPVPTQLNQSSVGNWRLPIGIEDHIEDGVIKMTAGVLIGGTLGMLLFKSGKGWRSASIASGLGVAIGSTYVRFMSSMSNNTMNNSTKSSDVASTKATQQPLTPGARLQPFDTKPLPIVSATNPPPSKAS
jgi:hypothetical protein